MNRGSERVEALRRSIVESMSRNELIEYCLNTHGQGREVNQRIDLRIEVVTRIDTVCDDLDPLV
jgi:hypothetical protein